jgi:hypothetical protein
LILAGFGFAGSSLAYETSGSFTSTNLLSGQFVASIDSFIYNLSSKPANTSASVQFSQNSSNWYSSAGIENASDTLTTGANNTIDLSGLLWSGPNFYYKVTLTSDGSDTPALDDITVTFTNTVGQGIAVSANVQEYITFTVSATSTALSPDLIDNSGNTHIASSSNITLTVNTSSADGYSITVQGLNGGLKHASSSELIALFAATGTVSAGTDAFGLSASSSDMTIQPNYNFALDGNNVGKADSSASSTLASKTSPGVNQTAYIRFKASCDSGQPDGSYSETISITAVAAP